MSEGLDDLIDLMKRADATQWGKACSALWAQAATLAEERGDLEKAVVCYDELATAYMMGGEITRCIAPFMWLNRMYKERPDLFTEELVTSLALDYKFAVSAVGKVPTISVEQCMSMLAEMEQFYRGLGDSLHAYYARAFRLYSILGMEKDAQDAFERWLAAEISDLSDCNQCDPSLHVYHLAEREQWDEVLVVGDAALNDDTPHCGSQPEGLLSRMLEALLRRGRDEEAWAAHLRAYRRYQQAPRYLEYLVEHLRYLALSGRAGRPQRLERGVKILLRHMPWWTEAETPSIVMNMAIQGFVILDSFEAEHDDRVLPVTLPGENLQWITRPTLVNPTLAQAREWMRDVALALADQFDARPGHPNPGITRAQVERAMNPEPVATLPQQGIIEDASGLGDYSFMTSFVKADNEAKASAQTSAEPVAQAVSAEVTDEDEAPLVPLPTSGPWQSMSFVELLEAAAEFGEYVPTIYILQARELAYADPSLVSADTRPAMDERLLPLWEWIVEDYAYVNEWGTEMTEHPRVCEDRAYQLIAEADALFDDNKFMEAAQLDDEAMRTPSVEPIGVRVDALTTMATSAESAGYTSEAIEPLRELLNLCAVLGLRITQADAAGLLAEDLYRTQRYSEAVAVAQSGLDILEHYPHLCYIAVNLHRIAGNAHSRFNDSAASAAHHFAAGKILERNEQWRAAADAFAGAANAFEEGYDYARAIEAQECAAQSARCNLDEGMEALRVFRAEGCQEENEELYRDLREGVSQALSKFQASLLRHGHFLTSQPGNVSPTDFARMEESMSEYLQLMTADDYAEFLPESQTSAFRQAKWQHLMGTMYANGYAYTQALDYFQASIRAFEAMGERKEQADAMASLAKLFMRRRQIDDARVTAQAVIDMSEGTNFKNADFVRKTRKILRELDAQ